MARIAPKIIDGLVFAIDRKTVDKQVIVDGKNFLIDLDGARSAFAHNQMDDHTDFDLLPESFTVGLETYQILKNPITNTMGIFQLNWAERQWELILDKAVTSKYITYKSSFALVGGMQYFAGRGWGVFQRNPVTNVWLDVTGNFPTNTFYITESSGRAIALADGIVAWSVIDDALNFTPSTTTGAGFQSLSLIGFPENDFDYRGLEKVADGFLTFTKQGIMKSTSIDNVIQFRHRVVETEIEALNSWGFARLNTNEIIFLTTQGLYRTQVGDTFEVWQPFLSEHLKLNELPNLLQNINGQIQIHYSKEKNWLFISITQNQAIGVFERAYVSYLPRGEWGSFNTLHRGFIDIDITGDGSGFNQDQLSYMAVDSEVSLFMDNVNHLEISPLADSSAADLQNEIFYSDKVYDIPNVTIGAVTYANTNEQESSNWFVHDSLAKELIPLPDFPSYHEVNGLQQNPIDEAVEPPAFKPYDAVNNIAVAQETETRTEVLVYGHVRQQPKEISLDCQLTIGLFRFTDEQQHDQLSLISNVSISMTGIDTATTVIEDWLNDFNPDLIDDWLNDYPEDVIEDWGINAASNSSYEASIFGSLDGYEVFKDNEFLLDLAEEEGRTRFYSTKTLGLYVLIKLDGSQVNDYIHLKHLELTGILAGRL